jgi:phenylalanyl-tRNA synthetase beta subunit
LYIGVYVAKNMKKKDKDQYVRELFENVFQKISDAVGHKVDLPDLAGVTSDTPGVEINLSEIISTLPTPTTWDLKGFDGNIKYKPFSVYPFMVRDVAVFVPTDVSEKDVASVIDPVTGPLMVRRDLFDVFTKKFEGGEEKTSYAFHIVFQSHERTLVEDEVNAIMQKVSDALTAKGWQVR